MKRDKVLISLFCGFIGLFTVLLICLPKSGFSENEKRSLASFPKMSVKTILNGSFESDFETYISDHFPVREKLAALNAYYELYTGRNGSNGVYKGKDGYLFNTPVRADKTALNANITAVNEFASKTQLPITSMIIPTSGYIMSDKLPENHMEYRDKELLDRIRTELDTNYIDIENVFETEKDNYQLYYKTDHHWTTRGAYTAYKQFALSHGFEPMTEFDVKEYGGFYGTLYSKSALWGEKSEALEVWSYPNNVSVEVTEGVNTDVFDDMFFDEYLNGSDMYSVFLGGNHALTRLKNPDSDGGKLLMLKDSYAHCIAPFLINHYSRIDMVDLRYYFESVSELVNSEKYDEVLLLYGLSNICESKDISILE